VDNVIVIGGMAAGCKAAARLSRLSVNYQITLIEKSPFVSFSSCGLPLFAAGEVNDLFDLDKTSYGIVRDEKFFHDVKNVNILLETEAEEINVENHKVKCKNINKNEKFELPYDYLILATGAEAVKPSFPYPSSPLVSSFHSPKDSKYFRQVAQKGEIENAIIIGGGFIGCEMLEAMSSLWGIKTTLIEKEKSLLSAILDPEISSFVESSIPSDKIQLLLSTSVKKIECKENGMPIIFLNDGQEIVSDYVFYCLGVKPNTKLAEKSNVRIGPTGGILVDEQMKTNVPNVWAAGDCVEIKNLVTDKPDYYSFGSLSNRMGRVAADSIAAVSSQRVSTSSKEGGSIFKGAVGTVSLKLFDNIICAAGLSETRAQKLGYQTGSVIGGWYDRPDYYPEVKNLFGKLVYEKPGLKLLGLQLVGEGEVTRYVDVFSELLSQNKKVDDLLNIEHGYTPAHSSPISPLNYLGYMAINQEKDGIKNYSPLMLSSFNGTYIDVRESSEVSSFPFPFNSISIPLGDIRLRIGDFDIDQPIMFVCEKGARAYEAARMFVNYGYKNVAYLGGGNLFYNRSRKFSEHLEVTNE